MSASFAIHKEEWDVETGRGTLRIRLHTPEPLHPAPGLLMTFATDRNTALTVEPYCLAARQALERGHRALSFDLPSHGERMDHYGEGITGFRNAFVDGVDPFQSFVEDGRAVLDRCMAEGVAFPGRVAVCGTSRGGYMALRLLASDTRIAAGAGFAPVTDWRHLREFSGDRERADVAALRLHTHVDGYIDRAVYMAIGAHDDRVDTVSCVRLYLDILDARKRQGRDRAGVDFSCTDDPGHTCSERWYRKGAEFLIERLEGVG